MVTGSISMSLLLCRAAAYNVLRGFIGLVVEVERLMVKLLLLLLLLLLLVFLVDLLRLLRLLVFRDEGYLTWPEEEGGAVGERNMKKINMVTLTFCYMTMFMMVTKIAIIGYNNTITDKVSCAGLVQFLFDNPTNRLHLLHRCGFLVFTFTIKNTV